MNPFLRLTSPLLVAFLASAGFAAADTVKMKNGEKYEGTILRENPTQVVIEYTVAGGSIKDSKTLDRKDIAEVIKSTPDQIEAAELAQLVPTPDLMTDNAYQVVLTEKLEPFLKKYPASPHKPTVEAVIKTYREEMEKAKSGARKLEGEWILPEELQWNTYNFEARLRRIEMQKLVKQGQYGAAYRILAELEAEKPASVETVTALETFKAAIPEFERTLDRLILEHPIKVKNREESNKVLSAEDKKRVDEAIKEEEANLKERIDEEKKNKVAIPSYSEWDLKTLTDTKAALTKEAQRINKIDIAAQKAAANNFRSGLKNFHEKSYLSAQRNFEDAAKVFTRDSFVKERVELSKKAAAEAARAQQEASGGKPLNVPTSSTGTSTPPVASGTTAPAPAAVKPAAEPAKTAGGAPVRKTPATTGDDSLDPPVADAVAEEASNLPMYLVAGAALLLIALLVVKGLAKKKAAAADE